MSAMESDEDMFIDTVATAVTTVFTPPSPDCSPLELSGVEVAGSCQNVQLSAAASASDGFLCPECNKTLKTRSGFTRHKMLHKMNDLNNRMPQRNDIISNGSALMVEAFKEIEKEPAVGTMGVCKRSIVDAIIAGGNFEGLINVLLPSILDILLIKTRVLPSAHLEDTLSKFQHLLCDKSFQDNVKEKLIELVHEDVPQVVLNRLVFRISVVYMNKVQEHTFNLMRQKHVDFYQKYTMSENDKIAFEDHVCSILRSIYSIGVKSSSDVWQRRCSVLRERCILSPVSSDKFLKKELWKTGEISLSVNALSLFLGIEKIFQNLKTESSCPTSSEVFNSLSDLQNQILLETMRQLSRGILTEDSALGLLEDFVASFVCVSGRLEAKQKFLLTKENVSAVSLRTDLKRNVGNKEVPVNTDPRSGATQREKKSRSPKPPKQTPSKADGNETPVQKGRKSRSPKQTPSKADGNETSVQKEKKLRSPKPTSSKADGNQALMQTERKSRSSTQPTHTLSEADKSNSETPTKSKRACRTPKQPQEELDEAKKRKGRKP